MADRSHYFAVGSPWSSDLLDDWRWLTGPAAFTVPRVTAMGSLFVRHPDGAIHFLNTVDGAFDRVADSEAAVDGLCDSAEHRFALFMSFLVRELRTGGMTLGPNQCYGWKIPLCLGGEADVEKVEPTDVAVHVYTHGQLHRQIQSLPAGTPVTDIRIVGPKRPV